MTLERIVAEAFLDELHKIAAENDNGEKLASGFLETVTIEDVEHFLKEAGIGALLGGVAKGVGALGMGAARGAGQLAAGAGRGIAGAASNMGQSLLGSARGAGQGMMGALRGAGQSIAAVPGRIGQGMTNLGQGIEQKLTGMGQSLAAGGARQGQAIQGRMTGSPVLSTPGAAAARQGERAQMPSLASPGPRLMPPSVQGVQQGSMQDTGSYHPLFGTGVAPQAARQVQPPPVPMARPRPVYGQAA